MKKYVVSASLLAGLSMVSGAAFAQTSGTIGANIAHVDPDNGDNSQTYGINGGASISLGGNLAVLVEGAYSTNDDADVDTLSGAAHLISRDATQAFGGFVGLANVDGGGADADVWSIGGEYAKFFDTSTLAFTAAYASADDTDVDAWGLQGEYRVFLDDNTRFDIGLGWANIDTGFGEGDGFQIGSGVEYRFEGSPISIGGNVSYVEVADSDGVMVVGGTLRFDFGNDSLKARDRTGNTFGSVNGLLSFLN
ncbi:MAG: hypothetical protein Q8R82_05340 [Hyphomonadaceae bacterium]|nr:hypothetical protein [Hyphomonadaceae bacterium]